MAFLSVNVNKLATLRNARGGNNPDVVEKSLEIVRLGAHGITVHPRPDERHIRKSDVYELSKELDVEFNVEGYPSEDFLKMMEEVRPEQCTLVPDPPDVLTSNAGWDVPKHKDFLKDVVTRLKSFGCRVSLFFDPEDLMNDELDLAKNYVGADRIELYTEAFATAYGTDWQNEVTEKYVNAAAVARNLGLGVNAGHDLDLHNLKFLTESIPWLDEVSIGHALICDALDLGMEVTIQRYLECLG